MIEKCPTTVSTEMLFFNFDPCPEIFRNNPDMAEIKKKCFVETVALIFSYRMLKTI